MDNPVSCDNLFLLVNRRYLIQRLSRLASRIRLQHCSQNVGNFSTTVLCLEEDYNTVVKTSATKELLPNFELELKKLRD